MAPPAPAPARRLEQLSWPQLQQAAARAGSTVVWPFGAFEQHGPQLPLGTDALFADRLLDAVLARLQPAQPIWRLPVQPIGFSPEHSSFCGTLSLPAELLIGQIVAIGEQLAAAGFERLVLFRHGCGGRQPRRLGGAGGRPGAAVGGGLARPVHSAAGEFLATAATALNRTGGIADAQKLSEAQLEPQEMVTVDSIAM